MTELKKFTNKATLVALNFRIPKALNNLILKKEIQV